MSSSIIYLALIFLNLYSQAQIPGEVSTGCPEDSICSSKLGEKLSDWNTAWKQAKTTSQKNIILRTEGLPLSFYSKLGSDTGNEYASWHSKCIEHKKKKIFTSLGLIKKIEKSESKRFQPIYIKQRAKEWNSYLAPLDFSLIEVKNSKLIGFVERENKFIPLSISKQGDLEVLAKLPADSFQTLQDQDRVQCPIDIKEIDKLPDYYLDRYCHYLKSGKNKSALIVLKYWSCP